METQNNEQQATELVEEVIEDPKAVLSALERAKSDAKRFREEKEQLEEKFAEAQSSASRYSESLLREKLSQKILEEGIKDPERVLKFVDISSMSLDDDLSLVGFEDQIEQLKTDLPEIFDAKLRVGGRVDSAVQATVSTQYSASEMQAMKILGRI